MAKCYKHQTLLGHTADCMLMPVVFGGQLLCKVTLAEAQLYCIVNNIYRRLYCSPAQAAVRAALAQDHSCSTLGSGSIPSASLRSSGDTSGALTALVTAINMIFGSAAALSAAFGHQVRTV
jgi:hypothetical protein